MNVRFGKDGSIAVLTLDRPHRLNAMTDPMWSALYKEGVDASKEKRPPKFVGN
jgi:enoyl-CoA hydratase/carnithine racemase